MEWREVSLNPTARHAHLLENFVKNAITEYNYGPTAI